MSEQALTPRFEHQTGERDIQVVMEIQPKGSCFMDHLDGEIADVELHFPEGECHGDVTVCRIEGEERNVEIFHHAGDICENCPGVIFSEYDTVPHFLSGKKGEFVVKTYLPMNHRLSELVEDLRTVSNSVRVLQIMHNRDNDVDDQTAEVDYTRLTDKQREALEGAVESGYYDIPGGISLRDLAEKHGISTSALSQRLARAEQNIMNQLFRDRD